MHDFVMVKDSELWNIILDRPHVLLNEVKKGGIISLVLKNQREYNETDRKKVEKNYRSKKLLVCGIGPNKYNKTSGYE